MANDDTNTLKTARRREARAALAALSSADADAWSCQIADCVERWLAQRSSLKTVATFAALRGEPNLERLHVLLPEHELLYPLTLSDNRLSFHLVHDPSTLRHGQFGIMEPDPLIHPERSPKDIELILCPGLAFAEDGTRLGRGKGFYDRILSQLMSAAPKVGVGFALQRHPSLPSDTHDQLMTHLLSEDGVCAVNARREDAI